MTIEGPTDDAKAAGLPGRLKRLARALPFARSRSRVREAKDRLIAGDAEGARWLLERARERAPGWAEPLYLLGRAEALLGRRDEEEQCYLAAIARDPEHRGAEAALLALRAARLRPIMQAWHLYAAGRYGDALRAFEDVQRTDGSRLLPATRAEVQSGIGWSRYALALTADARSAFAAAVELDPTLVHAWKGLGMSLYWLGDLGGAEAALRRGLALSPELCDAQAFLGWCAYARGDFRGALDLFTAAVAMNPLEADPWWGVAWSKARLGDREAARAAFEEAIRRGPGHPSHFDAAQLFAAEPVYRSLLGALADALLANDRAALALPVFEQAVALAPAHEALAGRAAALLLLGRAVEARAALATFDDDSLDRPIPSSQPAGASGMTGTTTARVLLARAAMALGLAAEAEAALVLVIEATPGAGGAWSLLAEARLARGDLAGAESAFEEARKDPSSSEAAEHGILLVRRRRREPLFVALERFQKGDHAGTLEAVAAAGTLGDEDRGRARLLAGRALAGLGRRDEALQAFREAGRLVPDDAVPARHEVEALVSLGRTDEARAALRAARQKHPDDADLRGVTIEDAPRSAP